MIAKIKSRVDFSGIVNYANNVREKSARIIGSNGVLVVDNSTTRQSPTAFRLSSAYLTLMESCIT